MTERIIQFGEGGFLRGFVDWMLQIVNEETDYEGSVVEREIDFSSEEIKSYLATEGLLPKFEAKYKNIKYFGVSSFNFVDAIHNQLEDINAPGKIKFECSSKRMELPFLWMLKQFAVIN